MRRLVPLVLLGLLLAACTTAGGGTTTTAPIAEPSTTTTTAPATTTTTVEVCTERDGVLRTRRGFVCPPTLSVFAGPDISDIHLPGRYETRLFTPSFRFEIPERFETNGEGTGLFVIDNAITFGSGSTGDPLIPLPSVRPSNRPDGWEWVIDPEVTTTTIGGYPATVTTFDVACHWPDAPTVSNEDRCGFRLTPDQTFEWGQSEGQRIAHIVVEHPDQTVVIIIEEDDASSFDTYWTKVGQPILDSIEYLSP